MGVISSRIFLFYLVLIIGISFGFGFVSAVWVDCYNLGPYTGGSAQACSSAGCIVTSSSGSISNPSVYGGGYSGSVVLDSWCGTDMPYCCLQKECWQWDATDESTCVANDGTLNCTWNGYSMTNYLPNGTAYTINGTCMMDWGSMGDDNFGGPISGCWSNDGNKQQCLSKDNSATCEWKANGQNQNPWCWIKTLGDAQN